MNIKDIPFIICNFNQLTFLRNLINQIRFYYPENTVVVVDNGSNYEPLLFYYDWLRQQQPISNVDVVKYPTNDFIKNVSQFVGEAFKLNDYIVLTDPDLSIHPATPPNFLEIFKTAIDTYGFHHAGFGLKTDDIPAWNPKAEWIQGDEKALLAHAVKIFMGEFPIQNGTVYTGYKAPIDTTFALYKRDNGGWASPMSGENWGNCVRLFEVHHLPWYLHKDYLNPEMQNYFATCKKREAGKPTAGQNHYNPFNGME